MTNQAKDQGVQTIGLVAKLMDDKKAEDIIVLNIEELSVISDYFAICTGRSVTQVKAIADNIVDTLKNDHGIQVQGIEGMQEGKWVLLDYGDIIIHVFRQEEREFYNLERLWADAKKVQIEQFLEEK